VPESAKQHRTDKATDRKEEKGSENEGERIEDSERETSTFCNPHVQFAHVRIGVFIWCVCFCVCMCECGSV